MVTITEIVTRDSIVTPDGLDVELLDISTVVGLIKDGISVF